MISMALRYNRVDAELAPFCESVQVIERLKGAGEISITLCNVDGRFTGSWAAVHGDAVSVKFGKAKDEQYAIKTISINENPRVVTWTCTARPVTTARPAGGGAKSPPPEKGAIIEKKKSWDSISETSLKDLLGKVCGECGLKPEYHAKENPKLKNVTRYRESGWALLGRYARANGKEIRSTAGSVIICDAGGAKAKVADQIEVEINPSSIKTFSVASDIKPAKVATSAFNPRTKKVETQTAGDGDGIEIDLDQTQNGNVQSIYDELGAQMRQIEVVPDERLLTGVVVRYGGKAMRIDEMHYTRTADSEAMTLVLKE